MRSIQKARLGFLIFFIVLGYHVLLAQPAERMIKVMVAPDRENWTYKTGENVQFHASVWKDGNLLRNVKMVYELGLEKMDPLKKDSIVVPGGSYTIPGGTLKSPGFLRCTVTVSVEGKTYRGLGTAGFDPQEIKPVIEYPSDFISFWDSAKSDLAKIPLDARMVLIPERCTENVNVYHVSLQNFKFGTRLYGIVCIPKKEGKYPALLKVPGAGVRPYWGDTALAEKGIITFEIGIHGIPVNLDPMVYTSLGSGALNGYWAYNLDNRNNYYYKRVYLGCVRANDFIFSLPQFDEVNLAVSGGSQGGALAIITAALDPRVKFLASYYPALCDLTGYLKGRAGGWPHLFAKDNLAANNTPAKIATCGYYDVVNFARQLKVPGIYSWGYNDEVCPPTSIYAAYNVITAPKSYYLSLETGHWTYPEQPEKLNNWLLDKLKGK